MAYRGGSSPAHQLNVLSQTLRQGMQDIGNIDLAKAQMAYQLGDPVNQLARTQAQDELTELTRLKNTPATIQTIMGADSQDPVSLEHFGSNILPEMEKHGITVRRPSTYEMGRRGELPEATFYSKTTGKPLTEYDFYARRNLTTALIAGMTHPGTKLEQLAERGNLSAAKALERYKANPGPFHDNKINYLIGLRAKVKDPKMIDPYIEQAKQEREDAIKKVAVAEPQTLLGKLLAERDTLPEKDPRRGFYDRRIEKLTKAGEKKPEYSMQQKIDDLAGFYNSRRQALAAQVKESGEDIAPKQKILDFQHATERWRIDQERKTAFEQGLELDDFGYYMGEIATAKDGKKYVYIGDDTWRLIDENDLRSAFTRKPTGFAAQQPAPVE